MELRDIRDLLPFLQHLKDISKAPWYRLSHSRYDAVMVEISVPGVRLEVEFLEDRVEWSIFEGDESVHDDHDRLLKLINELGR